MRPVPATLLCAICIPGFSEQALGWIQALRDAHHPEEAGRIDPHLTLVFPTDAVAEADFVRHVGSVARSFAQTEIRFRSTLAYREPDTGQSFLYLLPDEGLGWLNRLHQRLYSGPLRDALDPRRPWVPHVTLGKFAAFAQARALAELENSRDFCHTAVLPSIEIWRVEPDCLQCIHSEPLGEDAIDADAGPAMRLIENRPLSTQLIADLISDPADLRLVWPLARHPFDHDQWRETLDPDGGHLSFGVHLGTALIGHAALRRSERDGVYAVSYLYLAPGYRARRLGGQMIGLLEEIARTRLAATELVLRTRDYNPGAVRCYLRCGFRETVREGTLIRMSKRLAPVAGSPAA